MNYTIDNIYKNLLKYYGKYLNQINEDSDNETYYGNFFTVIVKTKSNKHRLIHIEHQLDLYEFFNNYNRNDIVYICEHFPVTVICEKNYKIDDYGIDNINGKVIDDYDYMNNIYNKFGVKNYED